jgi:hypothetical protein
VEFPAALADPLIFLPIGYAASVLLETPVLLLGLSARHELRTRLLAGIWLTACTYPVVVLVLPELLRPFGRLPYLLAAETFAPVAECLLFLAAFVKADELRTRATVRDCAAIVLANLVSFGAAELVYWLLGWS